MRIILLAEHGVIRFSSRSTERVLGYTQPSQGTTFDVFLPLLEG